MTAEPKAYLGIMVSSTFADLEGHRREVIKAIERLGFRANVMETSGAQAATDVIDTSLDMVRDSAAFVGVIGHRYGQTPKCSDRNPEQLSISELEFNEAMQLGRPILLFIMGDKHALTVADVESISGNRIKLDAFRERAKRMRAGSPVERIYEVFNSLDEFAKSASIAVGRLSRGLTPPKELADAEAPVDRMAVARPPELRAAPRYLGSHDFVGRAAELAKLDDWCVAAAPHPMLLFEAIGGSGKSMATWTWLTERASIARSDWAGRFWFSFYEGGATMTRFCREALAYITGQPIASLHKEKMRALMPRLIAELEARPWLIVLDGLERILVAYHRIDAPQMRDEDVDTATDQIASRDPRAAINPEDEELLRRLTAAAPSKILVTSRLTPRALINRSDMPMPGVRREILPGLRPPDAELLLRGCGVRGNSKAIQDYLQRNCDCHPLVIGALAGLVNNYRPDRGNFDAWLANSEAGGKLGLADMDLVQRRNHILDAAIEALPEPGRRLLQTLSLLQGGADYATLKEFNPYRSPPPDVVEEPIPPERRRDWLQLDDDEKKEAQAEFDEQRKARTAYIEALSTWEQSLDVRLSHDRFDETLAELERRGLLQYDHGLKRYDLHPVVRGVAAGRLGEAEAGAIGSRVVDYFSSRPHDPYEQSETLEDLAAGIQIVATLTRIGEFERAHDAYSGELSYALDRNLMAFAEAQRLIRPFFPQGWDGPLAITGWGDQSDLLIEAGNVLLSSDPATAQRLYGRNLRLALAHDDPFRTVVTVNNFANTLEIERKFSDAFRLRKLSLDISGELGDPDLLFGALLDFYRLQSRLAMFDGADALWSRLDPMGRDWGRALYVGGDAELARAYDLFARGALTEDVLAEAELLCRRGKNRAGICACLSLRGEWRLSCGDVELAADALTEALRSYYQAGQENLESEALLALARVRAGHPVDAFAVAERLNAEGDTYATLAVAELWLELGDVERAKDAALRAYKSSCANGEPYVDRFALRRAEAVLHKLSVTTPEIPKHDPANDEIFDWEVGVRALTEKTRQERVADVRRRAEIHGEEP